MLRKTAGGKKSTEDKTIMQIYQLLLEHFGPRSWWPAESRFEVIVGAILTQAVAWKNVEKAISALKKADLFSPQSLLQTPTEELAKLIKPALYHRQKTRKLKGALEFIQDNYGGDLDLMFREPLGKLRESLLRLWGIGPETADSILLYAGNYPIFVVDAYTGRIFSRLGLVTEKISYQEMQDFLHNRVAENVAIYNEYHALLVALGGNYCKKKKPLCCSCPLAHLCQYAQAKGYMNSADNTQ